MVFNRFHKFPILTEYCCETCNRLIVNYIILTNDMTIKWINAINSYIKIVTHFAVQNVLLDELLSGDLDAAYVIGPVDEDIFNVFHVLRYRVKY